MHFLTTPINSLHFFQLSATWKFLHLRNSILKLLALIQNIYIYIANLISCKKVMGNCIETLRHSPEGEVQSEKEREKSEEEKSENVRIKIVLTKEELEWLMFELQKTQGKKIEDFLGEIQRSRERSSASTVHVPWKPSLDSIVESPEVQEGMDRY